MRVALVSLDVIRSDGQGRVIYELARHALRRGVEITILADRVERDLLELGAKWVCVRPRWQRLHLLRARDFAERADRTLDSVAGSVDLIHGNGFSLSRPHDVNTSHFVHGAYRTARTEGPGLRRAYHWAHARANASWERRAYRQARVVIAVSDAVREQLVAIGVPRKCLRTIRNGVDLDEFRPGAVGRASFGLPVGVPLALFAGDLRTSGKNLDTVLHALPEAPGVHLAVAGRAAGNHYPALAARLAVAERVHFLGFRRDMADLMRAADVLVAPSRYDAAGLAILEALASGLPVISAVTVGSAEVITPECGIVLRDSEDVAALAAALRSITDDAGRARSLQMAARHVAEEHSWARMADSYLELYHEVAA